MAEMRDFAREAWNDVMHRHHDDPGIASAGTQYLDPEITAREEAARQQLAQGARRFASLFEPSPKENRMSVVADVIARLQGLDEEALKAVEAVQDHPELLAGVKTLASLAGLGLPASEYTTALDVLQMTLAKLAPQQPAPAPAQQPVA